MLSFKEISLEDKNLIRSYYKNISASIYNFTNLFMWQINKSILFCEKDGFLFTLFLFKKNSPTMLFPVGNGDFKNAIVSACDYLKSWGVAPTFSQLTPEMVEKLDKYFPEKFIFTPNRDVEDYVYEVEKMITHSGKKLHAKRNHLNYFKKNYSFVYRKIGDIDVVKCKELFLKWINTKDDSEKLVKESKTATFKLLDNLKELDLTVGGVFIGDMLCGFSIGEQVTSDMALIHVEVADPSIRGSFNIINQQFCENEWKNLKYVNREEDMGLEGLRHAKLAYNPAFLLERYNATLKDEL